MPDRDDLVRRAARLTEDGLLQLNRQRFRRRCAWAAGRVSDASVSVELGRWAYVHPRVRVEVWPGTHTRVVIADGARIGELVLLSLRGGEVRIGAGTEVRRFTTFHVAGAVDVGRDVLLSHGVTLHCSEHIGIGDDTIIGEWSTLSDSWHERTPPGTPIRHAVSAATSAPLRIGTNCWFGARTTVTAGTTIGDQSVVASGAVVVRDVESGGLVGGVPARSLRRPDQTPRSPSP